MFELENNKEHLYQWDTNILVKVKNNEIKQVHFSNGTHETALVVNVEDGFAAVPNILLQEAWNIRAYAYCDNCTLQEKVFEVIARKKPTDYVYTETEIASFERLEERINEVAESVTVEGVSKAVEQYLQENPIEGGATEAELEQIAANTEAIGQLEAALEDIVVPDMGDYYTKQQTDKAITDAKPDLTPYALKTEIPTVPDTSNFITMKDVEDKGYLTEHQSLKTINGETLVGTGNIVIEGGSTGGSVNEVYIGTEAPTDSNVEIWINPNEESITFATKEYVDAAIAGIVDGEVKSY